MAKSTKTNVKSNGNASMTIQEVLDECGCGKIKMVDFKFVDLSGTLQHVSIPADKLSPDQFEEGHGLDGSSIRGFAHINESDMLLIPDPSTAIIDPIYQIPTMSMICNVKDPGNGQRYARDPRHVAQKAEEYLRSTRIADTAYFGPELEFFVFDSVRFDQGQNYGFYHLDFERRNLELWKQRRPQSGTPTTK